MINIKATDKGDNVAMALEVRGNGGEILEEAFAIITELPKELRKMNPVLFGALLEKIREEAEDLEEELDGEETIITRELLQS